MTGFLNLLGEILRAHDAPKCKWIFGRRKNIGRKCNKGAIEGSELCSKHHLKIKSYEKRKKALLLNVGLDTAALSPCLVDEISDANDIDLINEVVTVSSELFETLEAAAISSYVQEEIKPIDDDGRVSEVSSELDEKVVSEIHPNLSIEISQNDYNDLSMDDILSIMLMFYIKSSLINKLEKITNIEIKNYLSSKDIAFGDTDKKIVLFKRVLEHSCEDKGVKFKYLCELNKQELLVIIGELENRETLIKNIVKITNEDMKNYLTGKNFSYGKFVNKYQLIQLLTINKDLLISKNEYTKEQIINILKLFEKPITVNKNKSVLTGHVYKIMNSDLKEMLSSRGIKNTSGLNKADMINLLAKDLNSSINRKIITNGSINSLDDLNEDQLISVLDVFGQKHSTDDKSSLVIKVKNITNDVMKNFLSLNNVEIPYRSAKIILICLIVENLVVRGKVKTVKSSKTGVSNTRPVTTKYDRIPAAVRHKLFRQYCDMIESPSLLCYCCSVPIYMDFEAGHIIPKSKGGSMELSNLRPVCSTCNKSMGTINMKDFMKKCHFVSPYPN